MNREKYLIESVLRAFEVLDCFEFPGETLALPELVARSGLKKPTVYRLLRTLLHAGVLERVGGSSRYRSNLQRLRRPRYRIGFAEKRDELPFSRAVTEGLVYAAAERDVELLVRDNRGDRRTALRNADLFIKAKVHLAIEFQTDEQLAPILSSKYRAARIPLIAIDLPHPGATFFGVDNYAAGQEGGRYLGRWVKRRWGGTADEILLLQDSLAGPLADSRLRGVLAGLQQVLPAARSARVDGLDTRGEFERSLVLTRKCLRELPRRKVLASAVNDPALMGALRGFEEAGRTEDCVFLGLSGTLESRLELRRKHTPLAGCVGFFPEKYGARLIPLALAILGKRPVPPAVFAEHQMITPQNVDDLYPDDLAAGPAEAAPKEPSAAG